MILALGFAAPRFLLGLLVVPLALAVYLAARRRAKRYAVRFTAVPALAAAGAVVPSWRRHLPGALALAALATLVLALAKPERTVAVAVEQASVVLVTDHSRSMLADDVAPNRLAAAQRAANTFIDRVPSAVRVGVVAYSDSPDEVQAPTTDRDEARAVIDRQVADGATATGDALEVAIQTLEQERRNGKRPPAAIVLLSDGKTTVGSDPIAAARRAGRARIPIHTIALGTSNALIPDPQGFGPPVAVPPDPATLRQIAEASGGRAFTAEDEDRLSSIYRSLGSQLGSKTQPREITSAFAIGGLVLLLGALATSVRWVARLP